MAEPFFFQVRGGASLDCLSAPHRKDEKMDYQRRKLFSRRATIDAFFPTIIRVLKIQAFLHSRATVSTQMSLQLRQDC